MIKSDEVSNPLSCLNRAELDEPVFVLLARDVTASDVVRTWCADRVRAGKNTHADPQIREALALADQMDRWRAAHPPKPQQ